MTRSPSGPQRLTPRRYHAFDLLALLLRAVRCPHRLQSRPAAHIVTSRVSDRAAVQFTFARSSFRSRTNFCAPTEHHRNAVGCAGLSMMSGNRKVQSDEFS